MPENEAVQSKPAPFHPAVGTPAVPKPAPRSPASSHRDQIREVIETIVFVVFLVLLLKGFVAEAFVIPTGSMATTLFGDHCRVTCERCGYRYSVNAQESNELRKHIDAVCPNCRFERDLEPVSQSVVGGLLSPHADGVRGGDKVLVSKPQFDIWKPERGDVIVFKYPGRAGWDGGHEGGPQKDFSAHNFIKRLWGLPGETLSIWYGDVYLRNERGRLEILRKAPDRMMEMRRIVYDNDYQPRDLAGHVPHRWQDTDKKRSGGWQADQSGKMFQVQAGDQVRWLRYHHLIWSSRLRPDALSDNRQELDRLTRLAGQPQLITDFLDYNTGPSSNWVRDLMLDFDVEVSKASGELIVELIAGIDTHRAVFNLATGTCALKVLRESKELGLREAEAATKINRPGKHSVRFANFDDRLTVWVDGDLIFGAGREITDQAPEQRGPTVADSQPAGIAAKGTEVKVSRLQLWRDVYYTRDVQNPDAPFIGPEELSLSENERKAAPHSRPRKWSGYYGHEPRDYRVPSGEYFVLGDNSTHSSDSRAWGGVPGRLLLGKAVSVYWPLGRIGLIR